MLPKVLFKNILYNDVQFFRNNSLFVLLYECTKKDKKKIRVHKQWENKKKKKVLFSFRRSADNHDLRDGHRHAGKYYCNRLSYCAGYSLLWLINWSINCKIYVYRLRSRNKKNDPCSHTFTLYTAFFVAFFKDGH